MNVFIVVRFFSPPIHLFVARKLNLAIAGVALTAATVSINAVTLTPLQVIGANIDFVAVVTDAGMPAVSDPGYRVVQACIEHGLPLDPAAAVDALLAGQPKPVQAGLVNPDWLIEVDAIAVE